MVFKCGQDLKKEVNKTVISIYEKGMIIGEDDVINGIDNEDDCLYTKTTRCKTEAGVLLAIQKQDFLTRVKKQQDTWNHLR